MQALPVYSISPRLEARRPIKMLDPLSSLERYCSFIYIDFFAYVTNQDLAL